MTIEHVLGLPSRLPVLRILALIAVLVLLLTAMSCSLIISNYGLELQLFGIPSFDLIPPNDRGAEPERYLFTPLYQIAVNNNFGRYNLTSPFNEDLRSLYSLPIWDWGLFFKPNYWPFFLLPPEYAYSFHHIFMITAFFSGYFVLFSRLGLSPLLSLALIIGFFYSSFLQYWYTLFIGIVGLFPWVIIAALAKNRLFAALATFYGSVAWLLTNMYPPIVIPLSITGVIYILISLTPDEILRRAPMLAMAGAAAIGVVAFYLKDALAITALTAYPGHRLSAGGDGVSFAMWLSQFLPTHFVQGTTSLIGVEAPEAAGAGNLLFLGLPFFVKYRHLLAEDQREIRRRLALCIVILLLFWVWILVPLPSWAGSPLLLHYVTPRRLVFGGGILVCVISALALAHLEFKITLARVTGLGAVAVIAWFSLVIYQNGLPAVSPGSVLDLAIIPIAIIAWLVAQLINARTGFVTFAVLAPVVNVAGFGSLNGVLSARPIFHREGSTLTPLIDRIAAANRSGLVALPGERFNGAILNGWGYRSVSHGFLLPAPGFYRPFFADLSDEKFMYVFNRMSVVRLRNFRPLEAPGLLVQAPVQAFRLKQDFRPIIVGRPTDSATQLGGQYSLYREGETVFIDGWALWDGFSEQQKLYLHTELNILSIQSGFDVSPFDGRNALNGFSLKLTLSQEDAAMFASAKIIVFSQDTDGVVKMLSKKPE